ncbi:hypothetical protein GWK47_044201 [Chionoecetes opilio]|uniref:Uncharacterized protein n=1 Tax=Chionoecetes opilio TaxID=41210 RepID=A0A8J4Y9H8_CHIOP|nr:hypothetical protein GWK47_044201 [Chionoecetes opilio]
MLKPAAPQNPSPQSPGLRPSQARCEHLLARDSCWAGVTALLLFGGLFVPAPPRVCTSGRYCCLGARGARRAPPLAPWMRGKKSRPRWMSGGLPGAPSRRPRCQGRLCGGHPLNLTGRPWGGGALDVAPVAGGPRPGTFGQSRFQRKSAPRAGSSPIPVCAPLERGPPAGELRRRGGCPLRVTWGPGKGARVQWRGFQWESRDKGSQGERQDGGEVYLRSRVFGGAGGRAVPTRKPRLALASCPAD